MYLHYIIPDNMKFNEYVAVTLRLTIFVRRASMRALKGLLEPLVDIIDKSLITDHHKYIFFTFVTLSCPHTMKARLSY